MSALEFLSQLVRIDSTNPPGNEGPVVEVLESRLGAAGFKTRVLMSPAGRPNLVARLEGPTDRPALVLLSHTDVVGVEATGWSRDPFGGEVADGALWGRGALDMKGIQATHVEAAVALAENAAQTNREVIVCAVADEEAGGEEGAGWLTRDHAAEVGFAEGRPPPEVLGEAAYGLSGILDRPIMPIVLGEKTAVWLHLQARGDPGHGSLPPARQAPANLVATLDAVTGYRSARVHPVMREQFATLAQHCSGARRAAFKALASGGASVAAKTLGPKLRGTGAIGALVADTVTLTMMNSGYKHNVVPGEASADLDCRLLPDTDADGFVSSVRKVAARRNVYVDVRGRHSGPVSVRSSLYDALQSASQQAWPDCIVVPSLTPGFTDVRYFRRLGATGYGWVPLVLSLELLSTVHGHDERIPVEGFDRAVQAMSRLVQTACT